MESIPPRTRGIVSGLLQAGYPGGYLLASVVYGLLYQYVGWRGMFMIGAAPALLTLYIRSQVDESPAFVARMKSAAQPSLAQVLRSNAGRFLFAIGLMTCFNFFSHGSQDLYPTFLQRQMKFDVHTVFVITVVFNIGAMCGGLFFGMLSQRWGRGRTITLAALLALPAVPFWAPFWTHAATPVSLAVAAFCLQFAVQGAWGIVPAYLNELSPEAVRGSFPGFAYQIGNLIAASNSQIQTHLAEARGGDYSFALALVIGMVAVAVAVLAFFGPEVRDVVFAGTTEPAA